VSHKVWHSILEPIVIRILKNDPNARVLFEDEIYGHGIEIRDRELEKFVLLELQKEFGVAGQVITDIDGNLQENAFCTALEITLKELLEEPKGREELTEILRRIISLFIKLGSVEKLSKIMERAKARKEEEDKKRNTMPNVYFKPRVPGPWDKKKNREEGSKTERVEPV
jgi:hypothetical protein